MQPGQQVADHLVALQLVEELVIERAINADVFVSLDSFVPLKGSLRVGDLVVPGDEP
jgi:hypothetical protein